MWTLTPPRQLRIGSGLMGCTAYQNVYGRKGGRGVRPWLLIPKVLAVSCCFGSLMAVAVLWFHSLLGSPDQHGVWQTHAASMIFRFLFIPASVLAVVLGILLFFQHPRVFFRLRWVRLKVVLLLLALPAGRLSVHHLLREMEISYEGGDAGLGFADPQGPCLLLSVVLVVLLVMLGLAIFVGRHKPRLGQNYARDFSTLAARLDEKPARQADNT